MLKFDSSFGLVRVRTKDWSTARPAFSLFTENTTRGGAVPFSDHPARNPVGVGKFTDPSTGESAILLGRYPEHLADSNEKNAQIQLQLKGIALEEAVAAWGRNPATPWSTVQAAVAGMWKQLEASARAPNADFNRQRSVYEANGIRVDPIPIFPTGEGGIHCLVLK